MVGIKRDREVCHRVFHKALVYAMEIDFRFLESCKTGWVDGGHFAR